MCLLLQTLLALHPVLLQCLAMQFELEQHLLLPQELLCSKLLQDCYWIVHLLAAAGLVAGLPSSPGCSPCSALEQLQWPRQGALLQLPYKSGCLDIHLQPAPLA
jgi:hypothetical protein